MRYNIRDDSLKLMYIPQAVQVNRKAYGNALGSLYIAASVAVVLVLSFFFGGSNGLVIIWGGIGLFLYSIVQLEQFIKCRHNFREMKSFVAKYNRSDLIDRGLSLGD